MGGLTFIKDYRDIDIYRRSFNSLTWQTYGFDFEDWYRQGWWGRAYIPYSFADGDKIAANVSVNTMRLVIGGADVRAVQLGTVMTDKAYRNRGLSRKLMDIILAEYESECDFIYLFANSSVLDFYPKFGFHKVTEYECSAKAFCKIKGPAFRKLRMDDARDKALFLRLIESAAPTGKIGCCYDKGLVMFYCTTLYKDSIYYIPELDTAAVAVNHDGVQQIVEIFSLHEFDLSAITGILTDEECEKIVFGFTPKAYDDRLAYTLKTDDNDTLFIRSGTPPDLLEAMFPILSKA